MSQHLGFRGVFGAEGDLLPCDGYGLPADLRLGLVCRKVELATVDLQGDIFSILRNG